MDNKFYLIEVSTGDKTIEGKAIYEYNTEKEAKANYHTKLGNAMKSNLYKSEMVAIVDSFGNPLEGYHDYYIAEPQAE